MHNRFLSENKANAGVVLNRLAEAIAVVNLKLQIRPGRNLQRIAAEAHFRKMTRQVNRRYVIHAAFREVLQIRIRRGLQPSSETGASIFMWFTLPVRK